MNTPNNSTRRNRDASPPAVYASIFVGVTGLISFITVIVAVALA